MYDIPLVCVARGRLESPAAVRGVVADDDERVRTSMRANAAHPVFVWHIKCLKTIS